MPEDVLPLSVVEHEREPFVPVAVATRGLVKLFGSMPALVLVDLSVPPGAVCAVVGGNGAGKTTMLRILATGLRPTAGEVRIYGLEVCREADAVRRLVDFFPAVGGFYPELSALENLRFAVAMRFLEAGEADLENALARSGLARVAGDPVRTFSSGMLRRLALARLMITRPRLALLDEPYAGLDEEGRELVDRLLVETRTQGRTAVVATHEQDRVERLADLGCRLERGLLVESWPGEASSRATAAALPYR